MRPSRLLSALLLLALTGAALAQQLYRWTDEKGRVHVTDSPPPSAARDVQESKAPPPAAPSEQVPYELGLAMKSSPVTLYTSSGCGEGCTRARALLNQRGIPFKEVLVSDQASIDELKKVSGAAEVPVITIGRNVQKGFEQGLYDELLDVAGYPKTGVLPPRSQTAAKPAAREAAKAEPAAPPPVPAGPYAPKAPRKPQAEPPKRYAPIPGKDQPITGPYGKPAAEPEQQK